MIVVQRRILSCSVGQGWICPISRNDREMNRAEPIDFAVKKIHWAHNSSPS